MRSNLPTELTIVARGGRTYRALRPLDAPGTRWLAEVATSKGLGGLVEVQVLAQAGALSPARVVRLASQARQLAGLHHPGLVVVQDVVTADGHTALVTAHVPGRGLDEILEDGPLQPRLACQLGARIAAAVGAAHSLHDPATGLSAGIVHAGLRPEVVRVAPDGQVKLGGFGMSLLSGAGGSVGPEDDVYALGALLFHLVAGQALGDVTPSPRRHDEEVKDRLRGLDGRLAPLAEQVRACLAFRAQLRPEANDVARNLVTLASKLDGPSLLAWAPDAAAPRELAELATGPLPALAAPRPAGAPVGVRAVQPTVAPLDEAAADEEPVEVGPPLRDQPEDPSEPALQVASPELATEPTRSAAPLPTAAPGTPATVPEPVAFVAPPELQAEPSPGGGSPVEAPDEPAPVALPAPPGGSGMRWLPLVLVGLLGAGVVTAGAIGMGLVGWGPAQESPAVAAAVAPLEVAPVEVAPDQARAPTQAPAEAAEATPWPAGMIEVLPEASERRAAAAAGPRRLVVRVPGATAVTLTCGQAQASGTTAASVKEPPVDLCEVDAVFSEGSASGTVDAVAAAVLTCDRGPAGDLSCQ